MSALSSRGGGHEVSEDAVLSREAATRWAEQAQARTSHEEMQKVAETVNSASAIVDEARTELLTTFNEWYASVHNEAVEPLVPRPNEDLGPPSADKMDDEEQFEAGVFSSFVDEVIKQARDKKFSLRPFTFDAAAAEASRRQVEQWKYQRQHPCRHSRYWWSQRCRHRTASREHRRLCDPSRWVPRAQQGVLDRAGPFLQLGLRRRWWRQCRPRRRPRRRRRRRRRYRRG